MFSFIYTYVYICKFVLVIHISLFFLPRPLKKAGLPHFLSGLGNCRTYSSMPSYLCGYGCVAMFIDAENGIGRTSSISGRGCWVHFTLLTFRNTRINLFLPASYVRYVKPDVGQQYWSKTTSNLKHWWCRRESISLHFFRNNHGNAQFTHTHTHLKIRINKTIHKIHKHYRI